MEASFLFSLEVVSFSTQRPIPSTPALFLPCFILEWDDERPGKQGGKEIMISLISWQERNVNQRM